MKTIILTTIYPGLEPYLQDFLNSLSNQTENKFDLLILNNEFQNIEKYLGDYNLSLKTKSSNGTPSFNRKAGINWAISLGAEIIIFADADDYFSNNRVELSNELLSQNDIIFNELILFGKDLEQTVPMLGKHFKEQNILRAQNIKHSNCLGLSNTAIKVNKISSKFNKISDSIIAFDWAFFALCLHDGTEAIFTPDIQTFYRQHDKNVASPNNFSEDQILRGVGIKTDHYKMLSGFYPEYISLSQEFCELANLLSSDHALTQKYVEEIRKQYTNVPFWWEPIKTLKELGL